jgi:hypothetical protein
MEAAGDSAMKRFADLITSGKGKLPVHQLQES